MMDRVQAVWAMLDGWERATLVALVVATVEQLIFVAVYMTRSWYQYRVGRALMGKSASFAVVLLLTVIGSFYVFPEWVWTLGMTAIAVFIGYQTYVLLTSPRYLSIDQEVDNL